MNQSSNNLVSTSINDRDRLPMVGKLALEFGNISIPLTVLKSAAGFYLGTATAEGDPYTRESDEYWTTHKAATAALRDGDWTQRLCL